MIAQKIADFDIYGFLKKSYTKPERKEDKILEEANILFEKIKSELTTKPNLTNRFGLLEELYGLRIKIISWLLEHKMFQELEEGIKHGVKLSEEIKTDKKFFYLAENIFYALKAKMNFMEAVTQDKDFMAKGASDFKLNAPTNYSNLITVIGQQSKSKQEAQSTFDFLNSSLDIEFVLISASIAHDEKINLSENILNELSEIVVEAAQKFSGIYFSMLQSNVTYDFSKETFDEDFIKEQQFLADTGLEDLSNL